MKVLERFSMLLLLLTVVLSLSAQERFRGDTLPVRGELSSPVLPLKDELLALPASSSVQPLVGRYGLAGAPPAVSPYALPRLSQLSPAFPLPVDAVSLQRVVPGLVDERAVSIGKGFAAGPLFFYGGSSLTRMGSSFGGSFTQPAVNGSLGLRVNSWLTVGGYGQYAPGLNAAALPLYAPLAPQSRYGGFADIKFSEHWGIHIEYGRELNPFTGKWETRRTVSPMYYGK